MDSESIANKVLSFISNDIIDFNIHKKKNSLL